MSEESSSHPEDLPVDLPEDQPVPQPSAPIPPGYAPPMTGSSNRKAVAAGAGLVGGGCLIGSIALALVVIAMITMLGDIMSGATVPGHGQADIDQQAATIDNMSGLMVFALICVLVGVVVLVSKRKK